MNKCCFLLCKLKKKKRLHNKIKKKKLRNNISNQKYVKSGVNALSSTSSSFGTAVASTKFDAGTNGIDESIKAQALAEEEAAMNQYKVNSSQISN